MCSASVQTWKGILKTRNTNHLVQVASFLVCVCVCDIPLVISNQLLHFQNFNFFKICPYTNCCHFFHLSFSILYIVLYPPLICYKAHIYIISRYIKKLLFPFLNVSHFSFFLSFFLFGFFFFLLLTLVPLL